MDGVINSLEILPHSPPKLATEDMRVPDSILYSLNIIQGKLLFIELHQIIPLEQLVRDESSHESHGGQHSGGCTALAALNWLRVDLLAQRVTEADCGQLLGIKVKVVAEEDGGHVAQGRVELVGAAAVILEQVAAVR